MIYKIPYEEDCSWTFAVKERSFSKILKIEIDPKRQFRKNKQRTVKKTHVLILKVYINRYPCL